MPTYLSHEDQPYDVRRGEYILTERLHGDYEGKLHIMEVEPSRPRIRKLRERIIEQRSTAPLFGKPRPKAEVARDLEIWQKL